MTRSKAYVPTELETEDHLRALAQYAYDAGAKDRGLARSRWNWKSQDMQDAYDLGYNGEQSK